MEVGASGSRGGNVMIQDLPDGARLRLTNGSIAEVTGNPRDGAWIYVRYVSCPADPSKEGSEDLVWCLDVAQAL